MNMNMNMNAAMPDMGAACDTMKSVEQKAQDTIKCMMQKANTTVEKAKKAIEDAQDCDFSNLDG
jgi:ribosome maturation protein Sdo1